MANRRRRVTVFAPHPEPITVQVQSTLSEPSSHKVSPYPITSLFTLSVSAPNRGTARVSFMPPSHSAAGPGIRVVPLANGTSIMRRCG